jgi:hypothetical protein
VRQIRQQNQGGLGREPVFSARIEVKAAFVVAELFHFSPASRIITGHQCPF